MGRVAISRAVVVVVILVLALGAFLILDAQLGWGIWTDRWEDVGR